MGAHTYILVGVKAVGRCVRNFSPTVGVIAPINAVSNVEFTVGVNPQSAIDKEASDDNVAPQAYISDDESAGVCTLIS